MTSILQLEIIHRNLRANKRKNNKCLISRATEKGIHSRSRNNKRIVESKSKSKSQKCTEIN